MPALSVAKTWKECDPSERFDAAKGEAQLAATLPSSEQKRVALSFALKVKETFRSMVGEVAGTREAIEETGATLSTTHELATVAL